MVFGWLLLRTSSGIGVTISNNGFAPISDVVLSFSGGNHQFRVLNSGQTEKVRVRPKGESHLMISFLDSTGMKHSKVIDVYFESGYRGRVEIKINSAYDVSWVSKITT
jgi:hypothetical protein